MKPKQLIEKWVELFNQGNAEKISDLYHENAVNHQVANEPVEGKQNIYKMFCNDFSRGENVVCIVENIFEDGDWGILEWKTPKGFRGCGFFNVIDGKIKFQRGYWDKLTFLKITEK